MSAVLFSLLMIYSDYGVNWAVGKAVFLILVELMLITAVAVFFSTFSTPTLSAMFTLGVYVIGQFSSDLVAFSRTFGQPRVQESHPRAALPPSQSRKIRRQRSRGVHGSPYPTATSSVSFLYGMTYIVFLLAAATLIFHRREFK